MRRYWLHHIKSIVASNNQLVQPPPVFIVGTHKDSISDARFAEVKEQVDAILHKKFFYLCDVRSICYVSNRTSVCKFRNFGIFLNLNFVTQARYQAAAKITYRRHSNATRFQAACTWYNISLPFPYCLVETYELN